MESPAGAKSPPGVELTLGQFALVSYIPDPLARFLDQLRLELTPACSPHAHVTILPPRPIDKDLKAIIHQIAEGLKGATPFWIESGQIEVFAVSNVVYLGLARGTNELKDLYRALNKDFLQHDENFPYHPHITIAQNLLVEEARQLAATAQAKWAGYQGPLGFLVSSLSFVQHVAPSVWADVVTLPLGVEVSVG